MRNFRDMVRCYRATHKISTRAYEGMTGVPRATISRFERTSAGVSADSLADLLCWALSNSKRPKRGTR
jgi:hypothetical protein